MAFFPSFLLFQFQLLLWFQHVETSLKMVIFFLWYWWPPHNIFKLLICRVLAQFYYTEGSITEGHSPQAHLFSTCWHCMLNNPYTLVYGLCSLPPSHCIIAPLTNFYSPTLSRLWKLHIISLGPMGRWASVGMGGSWWQDITSHTRLSPAFQ